MLVCSITATAPRAVGFLLVPPAVNRLLRNWECPSGLYPLTAAALRLFQHMSQDLLKNAVCTDFHGCFAKFDVNGDGSISHEEFDQVRGPEWVGVGVGVGV